MRKFSIAWQEGCLKRGNSSAMGSMLKRAEAVSIAVAQQSDTNRRIEQLLRECDAAAATRALNNTRK
jgi:hypothetical protein